MWLLRSAEGSDTERLRRRLALEVSEQKKWKPKPERQDLSSVMKPNAV
jgi:hypothetical protein